MSRDSDLAQMDRENIEALHLMLFPFRLIRDIWRTIALIAMLILYIFRAQAGWIVDYGPRSEQARQAVVDHLRDRQFSRWIDITVDFRKRASWYDQEQNPTEPWEARDHFWVRTRNDYFFADTEGSDEPHTITPFVIDRDEWEGIPDRGIPYCHVGFARLYDTSLGSWEDRADPVLMLDRKAARMRRDYETAAIMVAALRSTLAHLKAHQSVSGIYGPDATDKPLMNSFCNAEGADASFYTPDQIAAFKVATYAIHLDDAPHVAFRYTYFDSTGMKDDTLDPSERRQYENMKITGMCLSGGQERFNPPCMSYEVTYAADIFADNPPLGDEQQAAEAALLNTATLEFWENAARQNGISDLKSVDKMHERAGHALEAVLGGPDNTTTGFRIHR